MNRARREPCGCRTTDTHIVEFCAPHKAEFEETHLRWQAEHVERQQAKQQEAA